MGKARLLNLGCGHISPVGWINVDGSNRAWLASKFPWLDRTLARLGGIPPTEFSAKTVYTNLLKRFAWDANSIDGVYMGEVLDNFTREDGAYVIGECYRVLKPGGVVRIRVPDYAAFWQQYLDDYHAVQGKPKNEWDNRHTRWFEMFFADICVKKPKPFRSFGHYHNLRQKAQAVPLFRALPQVDVRRREPIIALGICRIPGGPANEVPRKQTARCRGG